jgi:hypothetical protein
MFCCRVAWVPVLANWGSCLAPQNSAVLAAPFTWKWKVVNLDHIKFENSSLRLAPGQWSRASDSPSVTVDILIMKMNSCPPVQRVLLPDSRPNVKWFQVVWAETEILKQNLFFYVVAVQGLCQWIGIKNNPDKWQPLLSTQIPHSLEEDW